MSFPKAPPPLSDKGAKKRRRLKRVLVQKDMDQDCVSRKDETMSEKVKRGNIGNTIRKIGTTKKSSKPLYTQLVCFAFDQLLGMKVQWVN
jgi:hypothetical protein